MTSAAHQREWPNANWHKMVEALEKIAAPKRPDGTYNLSREACEQIAKEALRRA